MDIYGQEQVSVYPNGTIIADRFEIESFLAAGGMAQVYVARQMNVDRKVALKVLSPMFSMNPGVVMRFFREAKVIANLAHPNTVHLFDLGETPDKRLFIAMELLDGEELSERIRRGRIPAQEAIPIVRQVAGSLSEAHSKGIIHRDLKPDNIFLTKLNVVKVLDFGIAKLKESDDSDEAHLTKVGTAPGTPEYMSPEQARGKELDARSDLYSLGVVLYEMLCGHPPFEESTFLATILLHVQSPPPPLPDDIPLPLRNYVINRLLAKDPNCRPDSADAFIAELDELMQKLNPSKEQALIEELRTQLAATKLELLRSCEHAVIEEEMADRLYAERATQEQLRQEASLRGTPLSGLTPVPSGIYPSSLSLNMPMRSLSDSQLGMRQSVMAPSPSASLADEATRSRVMPGISMDSPIPQIPPRNSGYPQTSQPVQAMPPQGFAPQPVQAMPPQGFAPQPVQAMPPQGFAPQPVQAMPPQGFAPQPVQTMPPQGFARQPVQTMPPQEFARQPVQTMPPQGFARQPVQTMPPQGFARQPVQTMPPQGFARQPVPSSMSAQPMQAQPYAPASKDDDEAIVAPTPRHLAAAHQASGMPSSAAHQSQIPGVNRPAAHQSQISIPPEEISSGDVLSQPRNTLTGRPAIKKDSTRKSPIIIFMEYANPMLKSREHTMESVRLAQYIWNASILGGKAITELYNDVKDSERLRHMVDLMLTRKEKYFSNEHWQIDDLEVEVDDKGNLRLDFTPVGE